MGGGDGGGGEGGRGEGGGSRERRRRATVMLFSELPINKDVMFAINLHDISHHRFLEFITRILAVR